MFNKKTLLYLLVTFLISYSSWFCMSALLGQETLDPENPIFYLYLLGALGPAISALIIKRFVGGKIEFKSFLKQIIRIKVHIGWYLFIIIVPLVNTFFPYLVNLLVTGKQQVLVLEPLYMLFAILPLMMFAGGSEELGWRGVLLPELLKKQSTLVSTIIVSAFWTMWHIPLWLVKGTSQYGTDFIEFALSVIGFALVLSIVYIKTESIFMCVLFHGLSNSYYNIFSTPCSDTLSTIVSISTKFIIYIVIFMVFLILERKTKTVTNAEAV